MQLVVLALSRPVHYCFMVAVCTQICQWCGMWSLAWLTTDMPGLHVHVHLEYALHHHHALILTTPSFIPLRSPMILGTCMILTAHTNSRSTWCDPPGYHKEPVESFYWFLRDQLDCISLIIRVSILTQWRRGKLIIVTRVALTPNGKKRHGAHLFQHCNLKPRYKQSHTNLRVFLSGVIRFGCDNTFQVGAGLGLIEGVG